MRGSNYLIGAEIAFRRQPDVDRPGTPDVPVWRQELSVLPHPAIPRPSSFGVVLKPSKMRRFWEHLDLDPTVPATAAPGDTGVAPRDLR